MDVVLRNLVWSSLGIVVALFILTFRSHLGCSCSPALPLLILQTVLEFG